MAEMRFVIVILACLLVGLLAQGNKKFKERKEDMEYIKCDVCYHMIDVALEFVEKKKDKKMGEEQYLDYVDTFCKPTRFAGDDSWVDKVDLVEDKYLTLVPQPNAGYCEIECMTLRYICEKILDGKEMEFAEALYLKKPKEFLKNEVCEKWSDSCIQLIPPLPANRKPGQKFKPLSDGEKVSEIINANFIKTGVNSGGIHEDL